MRKKLTKICRYNLNMALLEPDQVERKSLNYINDVLEKVNFADPKINDHDKELGDDGYINVYNSSHHDKTNYIGQIKLQIKGTTNKRLKKFSKKNLEVSDLEVYQKLGGLIFFAVYINPQNDERQGFYLPLTITKINQLLENNNGKKSISLSMLKIPNKQEELEVLIHQFLIDFSANQPLFKINNNKQIKLSTKQVLTTKQQENPAGVLKERDVTWYQEHSGHSFPVYVTSPDKIKIFKKTNIKQVGFPNGKSYSAISTTEVNEPGAGPSQVATVNTGNEGKIVLTIDIGNNKFHLVVNPATNIDQELENVKNAYDLLENHYIYLDRKKLNFKSIDKSAKSNKFISCLKKRISLLKLFKKATNLTHIDFYHQDQYSEKDRRQLFHILKAVEHPDLIQKTAINFVVLDQKHYIIVSYPNKISTIYRNDASRFFTQIVKTTGKEYIKVNPYMVNPPDQQIEKISDFDDTLVTKWFEEYPDAFNRSEARIAYNDYGLKLLLSYDRSKNAKFLNLSIFIFKKLLDSTRDESSSQQENDVYFLNLMQCKQRLGINKEIKEIKKLTKLFETSKDGTTKLSAAILLDLDYLEIIKIKESLNNQEKTNIESYPIMNLLTGTVISEKSK